MKETMAELDVRIVEAEQKERELVSILREHQEYMEAIYKKRRWWTRFLHYCNSNCFNLF